MNMTSHFSVYLKSIFVLGIMIAFHSCSTSQVRDNERNNDTNAIKDTTEIEVEQPKIYTVDYLLGKFTPESDTNFIEIPAKYCSRNGMLMRREAFGAFKEMFEAAETEGVNLKIISATRNFNYQKGIWERKWTGKTLVGGKDLSNTPGKERALAILKYSSMPGTSRHHWGTDIDLNELTNSYFEAGEGLIVYQWLLNNAPNYGFCQPYSEKGEQRPNGYEEEKWHWSYMPLSEELTEAYKERISYDMIKGFKGDETAKEIEVIKKYVLGINSQCIAP